MLTGNIRYRKSLFGKILVQVEERTRHCNDLNGSGYFDEYDVVAWRDAKETDFVRGFELAGTSSKQGNES